MGKTLYDYIIEEYGFHEDKKRIVIMICDYDDLVRVEITPMRLLKSCSFYELDTLDVLSVKNQIIICQRY